MTRIYLMPEPEFPMGEVIVTAATRASLPDEDVRRALIRHGQRDWGDVPRERWDENDAAAEEGGPIRSMYRAGYRTEFRVETDADGKRTTVFLSREH